MKKRALSVLLLLTMLVSMVPAYAMDSGADGSRGEILSFEGLEKTEYAAPVGTEQADLDLPETVAATVREMVMSQVQLEDGELLTPTYEDERTAEISVVWTCGDYDKDTAGSYTFTAGAEGYTLAGDAEWPAVTVTLEAEEPGDPAGAAPEQGGEPGNDAPGNEEPGDTATEDEPGQEPEPGPADDHAQGPANGTEPQAE